MYHDASSAVLLDLRRRLEAVGVVLHAAIRDGVTLARSLELTVQWDGTLRIGPVVLLLCRTLRSPSKVIGVYSWSCCAS